MSLFYYTNTMKILIASVTLNALNSLTIIVEKLRNALPHNCVLCDNQTEHFHNHLCQICRNDLPLPQYLCLGCAIPLVHQQPFCGQCQKSPPRYKLITCAGYVAPLKQLISSLKYKENQIIARELALHLAKRVKHLIDNNQLATPQYLIPVPLHKKRLQQRGYNQAALIADALASHLNIPVLDCTTRILNTTTQTELNAAERRANLRDAFKLVDDISGNIVAIIDDVYTTGATMHELAKTLECKHQLQIQCWSIVRTNIE